MGNCCGRRYDEGEEFVRSTITRMELATATFEGLLKTLNLHAKDGFVSKKYASDVLEPLFVDHDKKETTYARAQRKLYDYVMHSLKDNTNVYEVLFYVYPFINHRGEERVVKLFELFNHINGEQLTHQKLALWFKKYLEYVTDVINNQIYYELESGKAKNELSELIAKVYTSAHISTKFNFYMEGLRADVLDHSLITRDEFVRHFRNYDLSRFEDVRDRFLIDYGDK